MVDKIEPVASEQIEEQTKRILHQFTEEPTEVILKGWNDTVEVELRCIEFPPASLHLRPMNLTVDGVPVFNTGEIAGDEEFEARTVDEGEVVGLGDYCLVRDYSIIGEGPGPAELTLEIETEVGV